MNIFQNRGWIPNSLTMGNLTFGFLSIVFAADRLFFFAGVCIFLAALCDGFDGQVARLLHAESKIGAELDSLADLVAFGVAPGYLAYNAYLYDLTIFVSRFEFRAGALIAAVMPVCAAYRLARFNVVHEKTTFSGLPSPIAGLIIALLPITSHLTGISFDISKRPDLFIPFFVLVSILMVSTITFSKPQEIILSRIHGVKLVLFLVILLIPLIIFRRWSLFILQVLILIYLLSGVVSFVIQTIQDHGIHRENASK